MSKIKSYTIKTPVIAQDEWIGSNGITGETKNFTAKDVADFVVSGLNPVIGGNLKITEIAYTGVLTTPEAVANALNPSYTVAQYEVLIFNVNGNKYQFKLQEVTIGVTQTAVNDTDFIPITLVATALNETISFYKGYNQDTGREEFYSIGSESFSVTKEIVDAVETGRILIEQTAQTNIGGGLSVYKGLNNSTKKQEFKTLGSNGTILIREEMSGGNPTGKILFDLPTSSSVEALIVNNGYTPTYDEWVLAGGVLGDNFYYKGDGTAGKPFTDSIKYTSTTVYTQTANSSIDNALLAYVGSGTKSAPEKIGQRIIIQNSVDGYVNANDLNYEGIDIEFQGDTTFTTTGKFIDLDNAYFSTSSKPKITILEGIIVTINGTGLNNSGNTISTTNYNSSKTLDLLGTGLLYCPTNNASVYLLESDPNSNGNGTTGFHNDGGYAFNVQCNVRSDYGGIYKIGGDSSIRILSEITSGLATLAVTTNLKAFHQTGGKVVLEKTASLSCFGNSRRDDFLTFTPTNSFTPTFVNNGASFFGLSTNLFNKTNTSYVNFQCTNSISSYVFDVTNIFASANLWIGLFDNNVFQTGSVDNTKFDLTSGNSISTINTIGANQIFALITTTSKYDAQTFLPANSLFKQQNIITSGSFLVGQQYKIKTIGTTNFTLIGATANTVGLWFTASGVGTGTGTAYFEQIQIV